MKVAFDSALDALVVAKPNAAAEGLEQLMKKRLEVLDRIQTRLDETKTI